MNPILIVGIVALVLGGAAALEGKLLLDAHEKMGDLKVQVKERDGIIAQKERDADLSTKLVGLQNAIETKLKTVGNDTRQAISNASTDDAAANAARDGVMQFRARAGGSGSPTP